jgi:hypothetical protein
MSFHLVLSDDQDRSQDDLTIEISLEFPPRNLTTLNSRMNLDPTARKPSEAPTSHMSVDI